ATASARWEIAELLLLGVGERVRVRVRLVQGLDLCCCQRVGRTSLSDPLAVAVVPDVPGNAFAYAGIDIGVVTRHRPGSSGLQRGEREERTAEVRPFQAC